MRWQLAASVHLLVLSRLGELPFATVTPEGLEDLDCRTTSGEETLVQAKEVGAGAGRLTASVVGEAIVHAMRTTAGSIVLLTDGHLGSGLGFTGWEASLGTEATSLVDDLIRRGIPATEAAEAVRRVRLIRLPWNVREATESLIAEQLGAHPAVASLAVGELYDLLGGAAAEQRHHSADDARTLTVGDVDNVLAHVQSVVDVTGLDAAIGAGVCRPADYTRIGATTAGQFYLGVDGSPGHITQGLDVIRVSEMAEITEATQAERYAVITGPSGSGKSVLLWRAARDVILGARTVRVARVADDEDVRLLVRHVELLNPTDTSPVVIAADNLGRPRTFAWPEAVDALRELPNVFLIGACREEDFNVRLLRGAARVVRPSLDPPTARLIAERIETAGLALKMTADEAFRRSDGLLMEYLSLAREGKRLEQVLAAQAAELALPGRELQRETARLVLAAHSAGLSLSASVLATALQDLGSASLVGNALGVLKDEHVVLSDGSAWTGLHELRSQTLTDLLHQSPPPTLGDTLRTVARLLLPSEAGWLLRRTAERFPDAAKDVATAVADHTVAPGITAGQVAELLEGVERADNAAYAAECLPIIRRSLRPGTSLAALSTWIYSVRNQGVRLDPVGSDLLDRTFSNLTQIAKSLPLRSSPTLESATSQLSPARVAELATSAPLADAVRLLEAVAGTVALTRDDADAIFNAFGEPDGPEAADLWSRFIEALAPFVDPADRSRTFGTPQHRATVVAQCEPSAISLQFDTEEVPSLTIMHGPSSPAAPEAMPWDPAVPPSSSALNDAVVALARQLASACPEASTIEVITVTPSGKRYRISGHEPGYKRMTREALGSRLGVRRSVGFQGAVHRLIAASSWTALVMEQAAIARELTALAVDAPFRLRSNERGVARERWAKRVEDVMRRAGEIAPRPVNRPSSRATSHAFEDQAQRQDDPTSLALATAANALNALLANTNHLATALSLRDAAAKLTSAREEDAWTVTGLSEPIPQELPATLERLARVAVAASVRTDGIDSLRFGDQAGIDRLITTVAEEKQEAQRVALAPVMAASERNRLHRIADPSPFPGSIDGTAWLVATPIENWDTTLHALEDLEPEVRDMLDCNVAVVAMVDSEALTLGVLMGHFGLRTSLPLAVESLDRYLASAGLTRRHGGGQTTHTAIADVLEAAVLASWHIALNKARPPAWAGTVPLPSAEKLKDLENAATRLESDLPSSSGAALREATAAVVRHVQAELSGDARATLAGELLDFIEDGMSADAQHEHLWEALVVLSLAPDADWETRLRVDATTADAGESA